MRCELSSQETPISSRSVGHRHRAPQPQLRSPLHQCHDREPVLSRCVHSLARRDTHHLQQLPPLHRLQYPPLPPQTHRSLGLIGALARSKPGHLVEAERWDPNVRGKLQDRRQSWHAGRTLTEKPTMKRTSTALLAEVNRARGIGRVREVAGETTRAETKATNSNRIVFDDIALLQKAWLWF